MPRYMRRGKLDGRMNFFSIPNAREKILGLISQAVARGSKITDAELRHLYRHVPPGTDRLY